MFTKIKLKTVAGKLLREVGLPADAIGKNFLFQCRCKSCKARNPFFEYYKDHVPCEGRVWGIAIYEDMIALLVEITHNSLKPYRVEQALLFWNKWGRVFRNRTFEYDLECWGEIKIVN